MSLGNNKNKNETLNEIAKDFNYKVDDVIELLDDSIIYIFWIE